MVTLTHTTQVFMGILEETLAVGDRILLFSQSLLTLTLIEEFLRTKELTPSEVIMQWHGKFD